MSTQICKICKKEKELNTDNFAKYSTTKNNHEPGHQWHTICKDCELEMQRAIEWKDDLLLCHVCNEYLPIDRFPNRGFHKLTRDGHDCTCKQCKINSNRAFRKTYSDETRLYKVLQHRWLGAKDRAAKQKVEFNLTKEYLKELWDKQNGICAISGLPMTYELDNGRTFSNLSIDRIKGEEGYVQGNVQLVCMAVNQMKSDMEMEDLYKYCEAVLNNRKPNNYVEK